MWTLNDAQKLIDPRGLRLPIINTVNFYNKICSAIDCLEYDLDTMNSEAYEELESKYTDVINELKRRRDILFKELSKINSEIYFY